MDIRSLAIHGGANGDPYTGAVTVPIYQTSTYAQKSIGQHKGFEYSRTGNPTREVLEKLIAELEEGYRGFAFGSGMAAISSVLMLLKSGDHILVSDDVYGGTFRVIDKVFKNFDLEYDFINTSDIAKVRDSIKDNTKMIYIETPTNPLMKLTSIHAIAEIAKEKGILTVVDNTFATPYLQRPITQGADIVLHSATKYLGGHSDLVAGLVVVNNEELGNRMHFIQNAVGAILGPFDSWLLIKGIRTLPIRMDRHCENAEQIVSWLSKQSWVKKIYYPGYNDSQDVLSSQMSKAGGMISFEVDSEATVEKVLSNLKVITLAESLGGIESLISVPAKMTHASIPEEIREKIGITNRLIRLSVGIEYVEDIIKDLDISLK
ncbi:trans-sulfuration enzyme family protein [Defluviitalea saccharophila]|uniref:Aminotransferase class I/II-fold pyridoxal phosphate-dependent enzyme n=1 Tax=Defluviitalea saccharophila TaxID=879970 RepID=A0ABZ2Y3N2_9FIRM